MATGWEKERCRQLRGEVALEHWPPRPQSTPLGRKGVTHGHPRFCPGVLMTLERGHWATSKPEAIRPSMHQDRAQPGNHSCVCQGTPYLERALGAQTQVLGLWKRPPSHTPMQGDALEFRGCVASMFGQ